MRDFKDLRIAVAGTGYVGLSLAVLLAQHHQVTAVDIVPEKVALINNRKSSIQDDYIEKYLSTRELNVNRMTEEEIIELFEKIVKAKQNRGYSDGFCYMDGRM